MTQKRMPARNDWDQFKYARSLPYGKSCLVQEIIDEYLLSPMYQSVSDSTKRSYSAHMATWRKLSLPDKKTIFDLYVHKVNPALVDHFINLMRFKGYAPATVIVYCAIMNNAWKIALRRGKVLFNPWTDLGVKCANERDTTWSQEEIEQALIKCDELGFPTLGLYIRFMYETGQRPWVDLRNLTWENIYDNADGTGILDYISSKTGVHMAVPISSNLMHSLNRFKGRSEFIFTEEGGARRSKQTLHNQFCRVRREARINSSLQLRDIRRTVAVELIEAGATRDEIRSVGGWKKDASIHRYARIRFKAAQNGLKKREEQRRQHAGPELCVIVEAEETHT